MRPFCYAIVVISGLLGKLSYFFLNRPILCFVRSCDDVCIIKYVFNLYRVVLVSFIISYVLLILVVFISSRITNRGVDKLAVVCASIRSSISFLVGSSDTIKGFGFER